MDFIVDNIFLIGIAFISGAMLVFPMIRRGAGGPYVNTTEATRLINREDAVVIDVREPAEYAKGHMLGAKNIPLDQLGSRLAELEKLKAKPLILACETGRRSGDAVSLLRAKGFDKAFNLAGGFAGWQQTGLPVEK